MTQSPRAARQVKRVWRTVDGVLLLDKPQGLSSNHALQAARRLFSAAKAGHTGTLDPMATGLLPLCFGEATKFSGELLNADKRYHARVLLGVTTDTADAEGVVIKKTPVAVDQLQLESVMKDFVGEISQVPPMHSALKRDGKPLYEYARAGIELERAPRQIRIYELRLLKWDAPFFDFDVLCSKGTYVRTLAADFGDRLGCGAHLAALRRTAIGSLRIEDAIGLDQLDSMGELQRENALGATDSLLAGLAIANLSQDDTLRMSHGQAVVWQGEADSRWRMYGADNCFIGLGRIKPDGKLHPERLVAVPQSPRKNTYLG
jgi:tRNA pseudouridine55 synthase